MLSFLIYAVVSAVTVRTVGLLPGRSFPARLLAAELVVTIGLTLTFLTHWGVGEYLDALRRPEGLVPGEWAMRKLYLAIASEIVPLALMVATAYVLRRKLTTTGRTETRRG